MKIKEIKCQYAKKWALENNQDEKLNNSVDDFGKGLEANLIEAFSFGLSKQKSAYWYEVDDHNPSTKELKEKFPEIYKDIETSEFPFKVGEKVREDDWSDYEFLYVKFIDFEKEVIFGYREDGKPDIYEFNDCDWKLYQEEKPKDLADVFEYYKVCKMDNRITVQKEWGNKEAIDRYEDLEIEVITKEEAIERGLKVD